MVRESVSQKKFYLCLKVEKSKNGKRKYGAEKNLHLPKSEEK